MVLTVAAVGVEVVIVFLAAAGFLHAMSLSLLAIVKLWFELADDAPSFDPFELSNGHAILQVFELADAPSF